MFPDISGRFGMFPDDSGAFPIVFGAFWSFESPEKSQMCQAISPTNIFWGRTINCWESFEMDFAEVLGRLELLLRGQLLFEVWRMAVHDVKITHCVTLI